MNQKFQPRNWYIKGQTVKHRDSILCLVNIDPSYTALPITHWSLNTLAYGSMGVSLLTNELQALLLRNGGRTGYATL